MTVLNNNTNSIIKRPPSFQQTTPQNLNKGDEEPQPAWRRFDDVAKTRQYIYDKVLDAAQRNSTIGNVRHTLRLSNLKYANEGNYSLAQQKAAILANKSLHRRLVGDWELVDNQTNKVLDSKPNVTVAQVPFYSDRGTFILRGTEYSLANQLRLRPGIYTRIKDNGEIEAHANLIPGKGLSHRYFLDPAKGVFYINIGQAKIPLMPLLKAMGASDKQVQEAWGNELWQANAPQNNPALLNKIIKKIVRNPKVEDKQKALLEAFAKMEVDPTVTQRTLGKPYSRIDLDSILATTKKLLAVSRGEMDVDDRDHMAYQNVLGPEELIAERFEKDWAGIRRGLLFKSSFKGDLSPIRPGALTKQLQAAILFSGLGSCFDKKTLVLTRRGWLPWPEVEDDDEFACRIDGKVEYHRARRIIREFYTGEMIGCANKYVNYLVTPNHRMWCRPRKKKSKYRFVTAEKLFGKSCYFETSLGPLRKPKRMDYITLNWVENRHGHKKSVKIDIDTWLQFLGWWLAEGSAFKPGPSGYVVTIAQKNDKYRPEIEAILDKMPFHWRIGSHGNDYIIASKGLYEHLVLNCGTKADKRIPRYVFELHEDKLRLLFDCIMKGDGNNYHGYIKIQLAAIGLVHDLAELWSRFNKTAQVTWQDRTVEGWKIYATASFSDVTKRGVVSQGRLVDKGISNYYYEDYDDVVYCAEVPGNMLFVMRNGRPMWASNSIEEINSSELLDKQSRFTRLGEGGIGSSSAVPRECYDDKTEVFTSAGWLPWAEVTDKTLLACKIDGRMEFHKPIKLIAQHYKGMMYGCKTRTLNYLVTPNHRMWVRNVEADWGFEFAEDIHKAPRTFLSSDEIDQDLENKEHNTTAEAYYTSTYDGLVYCAEVPGGLLYVRRNKSIGMWSGNSRSVQPSHAGFVDPVRTPECYPPSGEVYTEAGWKLWPDVTEQDKLACLVDGEMKFLPPIRLIKAPYDGEMIGVKTSMIDSLVTPNHRMWVKSADEDYHFETAEECFGKQLTIDCSLDGSRSEQYPVVAEDYYKTHYKGFVYCAEVPGGLLYVRRNNSTGMWSGNSLKAGVDANFASPVYKAPDGKIYAPFIDVKTGRKVYRSPQDLADLTIAFPGELERNPTAKRIGAMQRGKLGYFPREEIDLVMPHFENAFSSLANTVPAKSASKAQRLAMAARMQTQAVSLLQRESPLVRTALPDDPNSSYQELVGKQMGIAHAEKPGMVMSVTPDEIKVKYDDGTTEVKHLYNNFPYARKTHVHNTPLVKPGDRFEAGTVLASNNYTDDAGTMALGLNARVAYLPYKGHNFEDAVVISNSFAKRLASEHMYQEGIEWGADFKKGKNNFISIFPGKYKPEQMEKIDSNGYAKPGTVVNHGDPIILAARQRETVKNKLHRKKEASFIDSSVKWEHYTPGVVTDVVTTDKGVTALVKSVNEVQVGDKLSGLYGDKGVVSHIVPDDQMPTDENDRPFEMLVSPLGVISRTNSSQMIEGALGKIARMTGKPYRLKDFSDIEDLTEFALAELKKHNIPLKETVVDPETGRKIPNIFTGERYIMKLHHLAECYDDQTEVLTKRGWIKWEDATSEDMFATVENDKLIYEKPIELIKSHYAGPLYCFSGKFIDYAVTPNHRMYVLPRGENEFKFVSAEEIHGDTYFEVRSFGDEPQIEEERRYTAFWLDGKAGFYTKEYSGYVYCATMRTGLLYVRRNGKPMLCGNSKGQGRGIGGYTLTDEPAKGGETGCFIGEQEIITADGPKPISLICENKERALVRTYDEELGRWDYKPVTDWFAYQSPVTDVLQIEVAGGHFICATTNHEFYKYDGSAVLAGDLKEGDELVTWAEDLSSKVAMPVVGIRPYKPDKPVDTVMVYDITVDKTHKYCAGPALVSNSKRISLIDLNALLAAGATQVIRDAGVIRGQRNEEYWLPFMQGFDPPPPKVPMIYEKFIDDLKAAGINVIPDGPRLNIMAMTNKDVEELAGDRVITSGDTVRFEKGLDPIKGGLFDPALTGGHNGTRWCFRADTKIWTEQGMLTIGEIVNNRLRVKVKSYNFETGCFEWQPVTNWFTNIATDGVGKAKFVGPSGRLAREFPRFNYKTLHSTANHQVFRLDGTKQAISDASTLLAASELLSYSQEQLLYGTLLGDGYVTPDGVYTAAHCEAQLGYVQFKHDILSPLVKRPVECFLDSSGGCKRRKAKFRTCAHAAMHEARQLCYVGGRKTISQEWLNKIDELGLAFWVMDDGSVSRSKAKSTITVSLHTEGFSLEGVKLLQAWLQERWGCNSFIARDNAKYKDRDCGWYLVVSGGSAETILDIIAPYVPDAMRYKIPGRPVTGVCRKCGSEVAKRRRRCNSCQLLEAEQCGTSKLPKHTRRLFGGTAAVRELLQSNNIPEENLGAAVERWSDREAVVGTAVEAVRQDIKIRHGLKEISCTYTHGSKSKRARTMLVYDIEVAGNHNYFANGILVSNSKIKLEEPMPNPVMIEPIRRLLGVTEKKFEEVLAGRDEINGQKGPYGIKKLLEDINIDKEIDIAREHIKSGRRTYRDAAVRRLKYLKAAKKLKVHPSEWMLDSVPVLPPKFRPIAVMSQNKLPLISDANYLYKELISANDILRDIKKEVDDVGDERMAVYSSLKAVVGLGDPIHPKLREKNVKGILKSIFGTGGPKTGTVQRRLISSTVDLVGRAVITPDPALNMDEVALPENRAWNVYRNFVIRRLRRRGMPLLEAARQVEDRTPLAREELVREMEHRPVIINRAPVLHKFGIMAFWPKLTKDETLKVSPLIVKGFNADFDGDAMQYHVPVDDDARKEAVELMLPSKNLLSPADFNRPMHTPSQDYVSGLYAATASRKTDRKARIFRKLADAVAAYKRGEIEIDDPIEIED